MEAPDQDVFDTFIKEDLLALGQYLGLTIKRSLKKKDIQYTIAKHLVDIGEFDETALKDYMSENQMSTQIELKKLELEMAKIQADKDREERDREKDREQADKDRELELVKIQAEREERERDRDREERIELERLKLEMRKVELGSKPNNSEHTTKFDVSRCIHLVPSFQEKDVDKYFLHFEKVAENLKWPKEFWTMILQSGLVGKARAIFTELSVEQAANYDFVKSVILKGYELIPEAYRQKFRDCFKHKDQTYMEFARTKEQYLDRWLLSKRVDQDYDRFRQLILIEEFKRCIPNDVKTFIEDKGVETIETAATVADEFSLTHKSTPSFNQSNKFNTYRSSSNTQNQAKSSNKLHTKTSDNSVSSSHKQSNNLVCNYCKKPNHVISECWKLKNKTEGQGGSKPTGLCVLSLKPSIEVNAASFTDNKVNSPSFNDNQVKPTCNSSQDSMEIFEPFIHSGFVSLSSDLSNPTPIRILRDTGASQSLLLADVLPFSEMSFSGTNVLIRGIDSSNFSSVPLHNIYLSSDFISGPVTLGIRPSLPFEGVHLLLGNDLAGDKVTINPLVTDRPCSECKPDPIEQEIPDLYPSCAVTRAMSKNVCQKREIDNKNTPAVDLSGTFLTELFNTDEPSYSDMPSSKTKTNCNETFSKTQLITEQHNDSEISSLFDRAVNETEIIENPVCYYIKSGILMRKWRPPEVSVDDDWAVKHQIVIPKSYRTEILSIAHETPLAGHLGINKTHLKILNHFYWPGIRRDVAEFCKSCHTCQIVGKPNQIIPKAPLQPVPAFEEPFSRVLIDCVGPLPKTRSGNQYMLTIMCTATRFPEAIPLRNITTKTIIKALTHFFTLFGLPKAVQSDQGSNFMSGIFQQVMYELGIKQYKSSAYHPESQGALERFHQTLKNMIRTYCFDTEKDWDEGVPFLMFAIRESVQESLRFSPFELVFGHTVRGPLQLYKEKLLCEDGTGLNLLRYVSDFRTKLTKACELARENLKSSQISMKMKYDKKSFERNFKPGQKVLALLPIHGSTLEARYCGPYIIDKKISDLNYVIKTPDRRKSTQLCHVNMLKAYIDRNSTDSQIVHPINAITSDPDINLCDENVGLQTLDSKLGTAKLQNSDILKNLELKFTHLEPLQQQQLQDLIYEYKHLYPDVPTRTDAIYHDVDVGDSRPIKQHPYRLNPVKAKYLHEEIKYLLDNDFIEPSQSNWSSPCILVPKPNGSYRMCTDYRKVNTVTKTDNFPIPRIDDCIDSLGNAKVVSKFDLLKGFWQVPLTDRAREISAFVTPDGLFQYKVMPFGMKNSPMTFQRLVNKVVAGLPNCRVFIDDVILYSDTWDEQLTIMRGLFDRLSQAKLTINLAKSEFGCATVTYLGHVVGQGQVKPVDAKVSAISTFPVPNCKRQLKRFLGMAGFYRKFCPNFSTISEPLTQLLKKNVKFIWSVDCQKSFDELKAILKSAPVLSAPEFSLPFKLAVDASDVAAGSVLLQEDKIGVDHPICFFSRKFNKFQRNYSTIEKECLSLILALQHFEVYLTASNHPIVVYSDHNPLVFLQKLKGKNQRLLRWSLLMQEYNLDIRHIKGKDNIIADCLSRI